MVTPRVAVRPKNRSLALYIYPFFIHPVWFLAIESESEENSTDSVNDNTSDEHDRSDNSDDSLDLQLDWNNLKWEAAVGKRIDCTNMIYTIDERQLYGRNRVLESGETAYLCRLYHAKKCKSRLYMKDGRLHKKDGFIEHNHPKQAFER